jgi:NAD-dependent dihydropyrimidine dehydrogenase PreA subunit
MAFKVDEVACEGDAKCVDVCPMGAIAMIGDKAVIDEAECITCAACEAECPCGAITLS